jgi:hypothetical protein
MKRKFNEMWESKEGSRKVWKIQAKNGILTFNRKKDAIKWQATIGKEIEYLNK